MDHLISFFNPQPIKKQPSIQNDSINKQNSINKQEALIKEKANSILEESGLFQLNIPFTSSKEMTRIHHSVLYGAEHLVKGEIAGGFVKETLLPMRNQALQLGTRNGEKFAKALNFALELEKIHQDIAGEIADLKMEEAMTEEEGTSLLTSQSLAKKTERIFQQLDQMATSESIIIPLAKNTTNTGHCILCEILKTDNGYHLKIHNTGNGLEYHYSKESENKEYHQLTLEINGISIEAFKNAISEILNEEQSVGQFYTQTLTGLQGTKMPPSNDNRIWAKAQLGGSCTASVMLAAGRSSLTKEEFQRLKIKLRTEMILEYAHFLKNENFQSPIYKIIGLEMVKKWEHALNKNKVRVPAKSVDQVKEAQKSFKVQKQTKTAQPDNSFLSNAKNCANSLCSADKANTKVFLKSLYAQLNEPENAQSLIEIASSLPSYLKLIKENPSLSSIDFIDLAFGFYFALNLKIINSLTNPSQEESVKLYAFRTELANIQDSYKQLRVYKYHERTPWAVLYQTEEHQTESLPNAIVSALQAFDSFFD